MFPTQLFASCSFAPPTPPLSSSHHTTTTMTFTHEQLNPTESLPYRPFKTLDEFFPFYLGEHRHPMCKLLHVTGTTLVILWTIWCLPAILYWVLPAMICGYSFAWFSHFFFEKNKPATFKHPFLSLASDFMLWYYVMRGKVKIGRPSKGAYEPVE